MSDAGDTKGSGAGAAAALHQRAGALSAPTVVTLQVTDRCNYDCVHCYQTHDEMSELSLDEIDELLADIADLGVLFLTLVGGEFFVRRDADDILTTARRHRFAVKLKSTGHFIDDRRADLIAALGSIEVHLSCYSANHNVHDAVTQQSGSHERTLRAAHRLVSRGVPVALVSPLLASNADALTELARLASDTGARLEVDPKVTGRRDGDNGPTRMRPTDEQLALFYRGRTMAFGATSAASGPSALHDTPCHAGEAVVAVNPEGEVWPCNVLPMSCGNVRERPFSEIWASSPQLRRVRALAWHKIKICDGCALRPYCGRCHAMAMLEDGDISGPSLEACRHAVATRDALRERGIISATETAMPPTWRQLVGFRAQPARGVRSPALQVLSS